MTNGRKGILTLTERIIAKGDVHACSKAPATLLEAAQPTQENTRAFLGDDIDRSPDSRGVLEQVIALAVTMVSKPSLAPDRGRRGRGP